MFEISENLFENFNKSEEQGQKEKIQKINFSKNCNFRKNWQQYI